MPESSLPAWEESPSPLVSASSVASAAPEAVHEAALVIDCHSDLPLRLTDEPGFDIGDRHADGHGDLVRMREGGLDAEFLAVWVKPSRYAGEAAWERAQKMLAAIEAAVESHPEKARLATTVGEIRAAEAAGRIALLIGVEGAHALGDFADEERTLGRITELRRRGVRYMTLTWTNSNPLAGSSGDAGREKGLTELGRRAVALMNDLGMMVDVSHVSDRTVFDVLETTRLPVIASHSAVRALSDHPRNMSDEMIAGVAKNGGAVCVNFYSGFLDARWMKERRRARRAGTKMKIDPPPLTVLVDHLEHVIDVAGIDHVCLGSDFDGVGSLPAGLEDVSKLPALTAELARRGHGPEELRKILGENVLRVMEANERGATSRLGPRTLRR